MSGKGGCTLSFDHVGKYVEDEMVARGWSLPDLAEAMGLPVREIEALIQGDQRLRVSYAERLGKAFGTSALIWLRLQQDRLEREMICTREELDALDPDTILGVWHTELEMECIFLEAREWAQEELFFPLVIIATGEQARYSRDVYTRST